MRANDHSLLHRQRNPKAHRSQSDERRVRRPLAAVRVSLPPVHSTDLRSVGTDAGADRADRGRYEQSAPGVFGGTGQLADSWLRQCPHSRGECGFGDRVHLVRNPYGWVWFGQINQLLLVLVLFDLSRPEGSRLRGIGVGIAAGPKRNPAFFVLYLLALRQWPAATLAAIAFRCHRCRRIRQRSSDPWTYWASTMIQSECVGLLSSPANQSVHGILGPLWTGSDAPTWVWLLCSGSVAALA